jgi:phosphohistidine phosphatase
MHVYLVQHAVAVPAEEDAERPLSTEGRSVLNSVAEHLGARRGLIQPAITEVWHSGKLRAQQTAEVLAKALCPGATIAVQDDMNPKDDPRSVFKRLKKRREEDTAILLAGHLPHLEGLASLLLCGDERVCPVRITYAGVLCIAGGADGWVVEWYLTPALLKDGLKQAG